MSFPYSYFRCPCADSLNPETRTTDESIEDLSSGDATFDPHDPRANFSLYPLEHLMWCESCHEIRCPRCVVEEIVCWFCGGCGFEVASSMVKSEGNRCTRNCFNCPSCTAGLFVTSIDVDGAVPPWILNCEHCNWTSLDIGITFEKPNNIHGQLSKMLGKSRSKVSRLLEDSPDEPEPVRIDSDARLATLLAFYKSELAKETSNTNPFLGTTGGSIDYSSPSSFARIMSLYTNTGNYGKKASSKSLPMRGAVDASEGLTLVDRAADKDIVERLRKDGLSSLTNAEQRTNQSHNPRFLDDMLPQATILSTKRSRRCRTCRHILVKPEAKVSNTRYRIKLVALSHIPSMSLKALPQAPQAGLPAASPMINWSSLPPNKPLQLLLTLKNPMFEAVRVTLGTPTQTPGRFAHRVTILSPEFTLGANADVWDEALGASSESRRMSKLLPRKEDVPENKVAEAGKVWEKGRNWTTVVVEVVCQRIHDVPAQELGEDEDVLEIPLFVRLEYEQATSEAVASAEKGDPAGTAVSEKLKRELAYWTVLSVGRIDRSMNP